jgi:hypothetical protein
MEHFKHGSFCLFVIALAPALSIAARADDQATLRQIEDAWQKRTDSIRSVAMKIDMEEFIKGGAEDKPAEPGDPFGDPEVKGGRAFKISLEYEYDRGKVALSRSGPIVDPDDPKKTSQIHHHDTFDGKETRGYHEQSHFSPTGFLEKTASPHILRRVELSAIGLWQRPQADLRASWPKEKMTVDEKPVVVDGIKCRRIRISRGVPEWETALDVDPTRSWVPIQWQMWYHKKPKMKLVIKYGVDAKIGPVVKEWSSTDYNDAGEFEKLCKAKVTHCQINGDIEDSRFTIHFPVGTRVWEMIQPDGRAYYIQKESGLVPIKASEFSHPKADGNGASYIRPARVILVAAPHKSDMKGFKLPEELRLEGFSPLAEGDSLDQWNVKPWHKGHWMIKDSQINYDGKSAGKRGQDKSLWTKKSYGDFMMYAEWRLPEQPHLKPTPIVLYNGDFLMEEDNPSKRVTRPHLDAGDSGLLFRGTMKCQANIWSQELGSGEINGYRTDKKMPQQVRRACIPIKNADRPLGEWNAFLITIKGSRMTTELNGERVIETPDLPDLPKRGPIGLQHHGDPVQFRQLWVKPLD